MCLEIILLGELHRMGSDHRQIGDTRQIERGGDIGLIGVAVGALHLDVKRVLEILRPAVGQCQRALGIGLQQCLANITGCRAGQRNQAVGGGWSEPRAAHFSTTPPNIFTIGAGQQLAQVQIPGLALAQQQQAGRLVAVFFVFNGDVTADDRLHASSTRTLEKFHRAKQIGVVGDRQRRHVVRRRLGHRIVDAHDAIGDGKFRVQAQVDKRAGGKGCAHWGLVWCCMLIATCQPHS